MRLLFGILVWLPLLVLGQPNLVPNGSFEDLTECPWLTHQIQFAYPWTNTNADSPDVFNVCFVPNQFPPYDVSGGVPNNVIGHQFPHSGDGYAGVYTYGGQFETNGRDYLQLPLSEPLQSGGYVVSFWASLADDVQYAVGSLGAYFSDTLIIREQFNSVLEVESSIQSPAGLIMSDKDIWYHITDTFSSRYGGEEYLLIGNFKSTAESDTLLVPTGANNRFQSYYYIDDVSVIALDTLSGIEETERMAFSIYPNPAKEFVQFKVEGSTWQPSSATVLDAVGRVLRYIATLGRGGTQDDHTIDLSDLPSGIYFLQLTDEEGKHAVSKFVKE